MLVKLSLLSGESYEGRLEAGDSVVIPRNTIHHVLGGSPDNEVLVSSWPRFFGDTDKVLA
jgi:quercetin dioxygenase-like cupin family protein